MNIKKVKSSLINKSYTLWEHDSGLKVYLYKMPGFTSYYGMFGTRYGSIDNAFIDQNQNKFELPEGIAHFLEHKLFESEDGDAFTKYAATGAYSNAYTSFDRTCYLFSCSDRFYENLGILLEFVRSPYFTEETVKKEQGIIGQEIRMYDDQPSWQVLFNMLGGMFHNHPVKIDIAGTTESISNITSDLLYRCYEKFYDLSNMFITLAGDFKEEEVIDFINKNLKISSSHIVSCAMPEEPEGLVENYVETFLDVAKPLFCIGFKETLKTTAPTAKQMVAMEIAIKMLVGSASPLYKQLLDEGLINEEFGSEYFTGRFIAVPMFEGESDNPKKVQELIIEAAEKYRTTGIDNRLFEACRRDMYGKILRRFDGAESICSMLSDSSVLGYELFDYIELIEKITPSDVLKSFEVLKHDNSVLSVVNPR